MTSIEKMVLLARNIVITSDMYMDMLKKQESWIMPNADMTGIVRYVDITIVKRRNTSQIIGLQRYHDYIENLFHTSNPDRPEYAGRDSKQSVSPRRKTVTIPLNSKQIDNASALQVDTSARNIDLQRPIHTHMPQEGDQQTDIDYTSTHGAITPIMQILYRMGRTICRRLDIEENKKYTHDGMSHIGEDTISSQDIIHSGIAELNPLYIRMLSLPKIDMAISRYIIYSVYEHAHKSASRWLYSMRGMRSTEFEEKIESPEGETSEEKKSRKDSEERREEIMRMQRSEIRKGHVGNDIYMGFSSIQWDALHTFMTDNCYVLMSTVDLPMSSMLESLRTDKEYKAIQQFIFTSSLFSDINATVKKPRRRNKAKASMTTTKLLKDVDRRTRQKNAKRKMIAANNKKVMST